MPRQPKRWSDVFSEQYEKEKIAFEEDMEEHIKRGKRLDTLTDNQRKIYPRRDLYDLAFEFWYIYKLQVEYGKINPKKSINKSKSTKWYDPDIITILTLMKTIHTPTSDRKIPIPNRKLIIARWLALDKDYLKRRKIWNDKLMSIVTNHKQPYDYVQFIKGEKQVEDLCNKNSFHKYRIRAIKEGLKDKFISFLWVILEEIDNYEGTNRSPKWQKKNILLTYKVWFENIIEKIHMNKRNNESNLAYTKRKTWAPLYFQSFKYVMKHYKTEMYQHFWLNNFK